MESPLGQNGNVLELNETKTGNVFPGQLANDSPRGMNCTWLIKAPKRNSVILKMKEIKLAGDCHNSAVHVRDGKNPFVSLLKKFCGQKGESSMFSNGRYLYVQFSFTSDAPGFDAAVEKGKTQNFYDRSSIFFCFPKSVCFSFSFQSHSNILKTIFINYLAWFGIMGQKT